MNKLLLLTLALAELCFSRQFRRQEEEKLFEHKKRIVGGYEVNPPFKYKFMIPLMDSEQQSCSGSLIHPSWVLTAGHCALNFIFQTNTGSSRHNITYVSDEIRYVHEVDIKILHPQYDVLFGSETYGYFSDYDIALLHLKTPATVTDPNVEVIDLDINGDFSQADVMSKVIGWGALEENGDGPDNLMEVEIPINNSTFCLNAYPFLDMGRFLCAGYPEGKKDSCQGDSGGPLFTTNPVTGKYVQNGIVSQGLGCARPNYPGVYTRLPYFINWINQQIQTVSVDPCSSSPCGVGKCYANFYPDYDCVCPVSHTGKNCEILVCPPTSSTCKLQSTFGIQKVASTSSFEIPLTISGFPSTLSYNRGIAVYLSIAHIRSGTFTASVISPSGKEIYLTDGVGFGFSNCYLGSVFEDSYTPLYDALPCSYDQVAPVESLNAGLNGTQLNGVWKLKIENFHPGRDATVFGWGLRLTSCSPGYLVNGTTCQPNLRTQKTMAYSIIQRFLFNGSTIDSNGSGNSFSYKNGNAAIFSEIPRNSDSNNLALNIKTSPAISSQKIQLTDSSFTIEIVFRVNLRTDFDLLSLLPNLASLPSSFPLRIQVTQPGRIRFFSKSSIVRSTPVVITRGTSYYMVVAFRNSQLFVYLNDVTLVSSSGFPAIPPSSYFVSLGRQGVVSIDELAFFDSSLTAQQALSRNDDF